jgi:protein-glutamine gamma-glutamyltransferase
MLQRLRTLPRDARDTLFLLVVIAWTIAPLASELPWWCSLMTAGVLLWRGTLAVQGKPLPGRAWRIGLLVLAIAATWASYRTLLGRDAGVTFIVVLLALKTLEMRAQRDAFVIFFLGFFTLLSNFFFSQSLLTAAAMVLAVWGLLTAVVNSHMPVGRPPLWQAARIAGRMALLGAPIMAALFVLFPRVAPLWGLPSDAMSGRSGLSSTMQVGTMAQLALDGSVAMRVRFEGPAPAQSDMYFRGPVLGRFDGRQWSPLTSSLPPRLQVPTNLQVQGAPVRYEVTLEGNNHPWVLVLDAAAQPPELKGYSLSQSPTLEWSAERPLTDLVRYRAQSHLQFRHGPLQRITGLQEYLELPPGFNPRTLALAAQMRREPALAKAGTLPLVNAVLQRLRTGGYTYTLEPGVYGQHTADEFWFDRKQGFCEHIASSFVLLMRALDVPARVVTGYQGGELNRVDGFWTVRQSDAHAWAEVWVEQQGWVRVDPTTAVAPARTDSFAPLQAAPNPAVRVLGTLSPGMVINLRAMWDAANNRWNQWVLNYSQDRQLNLLRNLGFESPSWEDLGYLLAGLLVLAGGTGALWTLWERHRQDPWLRLLHQARQRLQAAGLELPQHTPPRALAAALTAALTTRGTLYEAQHSPTHHAVVQWLLALEAVRYAPAPSSPAKTQHPTLATLRKEFRQLRWPPL